MILSLEKFEPFVPKWNNNEAEEKPIKVFYKNPTMPMYERLIPKPSITVKIDAEGNSQGGESKITVDNKAIVLDMVERIENFEYPVEGGKTIAITSAKDLFAPTVPAMVSGLIDEIGSYLQVILSKKGEATSKN